MAKILDGKKLARSILEELEQKVKAKPKPPKLSIILVGDNPQSLVYTNIKKKRSAEIGIDCVIHKLPEGTSEKSVCKKIKQLNLVSDGVIVQLPLPAHLNVRKILDTIDPEKDVDCLTTKNLGRILHGKEDLMPATPKGIIKLLEHNNISLKGKNVTIINHSNIVGKPLAMMLCNRNATVTICHKYTKNLTLYTKDADIIVSGVGIPEFIKATMVKEQVILIDVGVTKTETGLKGDVHFENVKKKASYITPVPGGVGPMTVVMLLDNLVKRI